MTYFMPTKVYEEQGCVRAHAEEFCALGTKAMLVTGRHSAKACGAQDDVIAAMDAFDIPYVVFDEVEENPSIETVMKARDAAVKAGADLFIGIGGGSPMDAAKAIALMAYHKDEAADFLYAGDASAKWYPVVCVPTTCGTGSEVTGVSVLTIHAKKTKGSIPYRVFPELALVDGKYLADCPASVLRNTATDAFCHLCESYINAGATDYSRMCALAGLSVWSRSRGFLLGKEEATKERFAELMRASTLAGMAIAQTGTSLPHGLSYGLTYALGVPHGKACGLFQAGYLKEADPADAETIVTTAGFDSIDELDAFFREICGASDVTEDVRETLVRQLLDSPAKLKAAPFPVDEAVLRRIVESSKGERT